MRDRSPSATGILGVFRKRPPAFTPWDEARKREAAQGLALLEERRRNERQELRARELVTLWPVGAGLVLAAFAPVLRAIAEAIGPSAMTLVFPFVVLAQRPEIQIGPVTHLLPTVLLYAQFPIEGLLARIVLRYRVRPASVIVQVLLFHFLAIAEIVMLSGVPALLRR